jgi:disulfide bond formation protein DsbB
MNLPMQLQAGDQAILEFGAQVSTQAVAAPAAVESTSRRPMIAIVGGLLILLGIGLGVYIAFSRR